MNPVARVVYIGALIMTLGLSASPSRAGDLVLKRVMLSAGGVAYLEHEAEVTDNAELTLDVPLNQVDDVLKSIVVYDNKGGVGSAQLAGRDPLGHMFDDLPFASDALTSPAALLNALQGAEIKIGTSRPIVGRLLKVVPETVQVGERNTTTRNRVSVLTESGLQQFMLEDADSVSFVDPTLQTQISKALGEIAKHRAKDRRQIVLKTRGNGARTLRVGYVVGASLWKASYRLTLAQDLKADRAHLQGWAVLENMSGQDWNDVELTLLSGNPVSFRQAIYQAYYVARPEVPVEVLGRVLPKPDTGVLAVAGADRVEGLLPSPARMRAGAAQQQASRAAKESSRTQEFRFGGGTSFGDEPADADRPLISRAADTAESEEGATQVAFRIPVAISIGSGQSALVPIVERDLPIERLALFQYPTSKVNPFASLRLRNDTSAGLPPGVLTIYEHTGAGVAYVGDARLGQLPAGEKRLISYAVDEKTKIAQDAQHANAITKATVARGVLSLTRTELDHHLSDRSAGERGPIAHHRISQNAELDAGRAGQSRTDRVSLPDQRQPQGRRVESRNCQAGESRDRNVACCRHVEGADRPGDEHRRDQRGDQGRLREARAVAARRRRQTGQRDRAARQAGSAPVRPVAHPRQHRKDRS